MELLNTIDIDKIDIEILYYLYAEKALSPLVSCQIKSIVKHFDESNPISYTTAVRRIQSLLFKEYINEGYKLKRAKSYFLSSKGKEFIEVNLVDAEEIFTYVEEEEETESENNQNKGD